MDLLISPVSSSCNLKCSYCYYNDNAKKRAARNYGKMSMETLETIVSRAYAEDVGEIRFIFRGGEPALAGLEFYKGFMRYVHQYNSAGTKTFFVFQTNGTLLNAEWAGFFRKNKFFVELSIDGYKEIHDLHRYDLRGAGTFNAVMTAKKLLDDYGVEYRAMLVVNRLTAKHVDKIYSFFRSNHFKQIDFLPCFDGFDEKRGKYFYSLVPSLYESFLKALFDRWYEDLMKDGGISIRHFDNWVAMMFGYPADCCEINGVCGSSFAVEADGSVFPCGYYLQDEYRLGAIVDKPFDEFMRMDMARKFAEESFAYSEKCRNCEFFKICRCGCKRDRILQKDKEANAYLLYYCDAYGNFFKYAIVRLRKIAYLLNTNKLI